MELPEMAQASFINACKKSDEHLADWETVLSLATQAFTMLLGEHMYHWPVLWLYHGAADKEEAGSYVSSNRPSSIADAVNKMQWHQHTHQNIFGCPIRREVVLCSVCLSVIG